MAGPARYRARAHRAADGDDEDGESSYHPVTSNHGEDRPMAASQSDGLLKLLCAVLILALVADFAWVISVAVSTH